MKIKVTNTANYTGKKDGRWLEEKTNEKFLQEDMILVHKSHKKINEFCVGIETCVYDEYDSEKQLSSITYEEANKFTVIQDQTHLVRKDISCEYIYTMKLPKGTFVEEFGNEYRFVMTEEIEVRLFGEMGTMRVKDDSYETRVYGGHTINVFTKKY